jgi:cell division protein FtsB
MIFSVLGAGLIGYALVRIAMLLPRLHSLKLQAAAALNYQAALQQLATRGWYVFHQIRDGERRQLGTIVLSAGGVFCLTARHLSRSAHSVETIDEAQDGSLMIGNNPLLGNPPQQAQRATMGIYNLLGSAGLDTVSIQPVLVFPSWTIVPAPEPNPVWVLNENMLLERLQELPVVLEPKQVIELCTLFDRHACV